MEKEYYKKENYEFSINIENNSYSSLRSKNIVRKSVRVFDNAYIGIAGSQSNIDFSELEKNAIDILDMKIPVNYNLPDGIEKEWDIVEKEFTNDEIVSITEELMSKLKKDLKDFIFSGKISYSVQNSLLKNSLNANYKIRKNIFDISILFKHKNSLNIIDGFFGNSYKNTPDISEFISKLKIYLEHFENNIDINEQTLPVVFLNYTMSMPFSFLTKHINGERLGQKASYFNGKEKQKLFSDKFSMYDLNYAPDFNICFPIDGDGFYREIEKIFIFEKGVFKTGLYDIRRARQFCKVPTGTSSRPYNGMTNIEPNFLYVPSENIKLEDIDKCIIVFVESGGDFQDNGNISIPIQLSFLMEYGKIKGKLPQLILTNTIDNLFNNDYIGALQDGLFSNNMEKYFVFNMKINK